MISKDDQGLYARDAVRSYLHNVECSNVSEMIAALTVLIERAALLIEHKENTDAAMQALYEPYAALNERMGQ